MNYIEQAIKLALERMEKESREYRKREKQYREVGMESTRAAAFSDGHFAGYLKALTQVNRLIDHLAEGKDADSFFKSLT